MANQFSQKSKNFKHISLNSGTIFNTEAKLRFANTSEENAKESSKQAKQSEIRIKNTH